MTSLSLLAGRTVAYVFFKRSMNHQSSQKTKHMLLKATFYIECRQHLKQYTFFEPHGLKSDFEAVYLICVTLSIYGNRFSHDVTLMHLWILFFSSDTMNFWWSIVDTEVSQVIISEYELYLFL